ncbi:hypothetical protein J6590_091398 [Homalodisca vitripennis]|nr:hypothetical protein J6590_091398 [Homalodisca vitripennis]
MIRERRRGDRRPDSILGKPALIRLVHSGQHRCLERVSSVLESPVDGTTWDSLRRLK